jgi:hypothetical protein
MNEHSIGEASLLQSSDNTNIEPTEQVSDSPDPGTTSHNQARTYQISPISDLLPQHSISSPSSAYNPFSDCLPATTIAQPPPNPSTSGGNLAQYLAEQRSYE